MKAKIIKKVPGPKSKKIFKKLTKLNGATGMCYPYVHSKEGYGAYFKDIDGNTFLDFASQIASNPLGYNHPEIKATIKQYMNRAPVKLAGQDFIVEEHLKFLEELLSITPKKLNAAFLINSGAEAVENSIKICMRKRKQAKFGISFKGAFHGRTVGALTFTQSKPIQKRNFFTIPHKILPYNNSAPKQFLKIIKQNKASKIAFIIIEHVQGEGGYTPASKEMVKEIYNIAKQHNIPYIADEIQSGMGRTGEWWAFQHYKATPDVMSSGKALNVATTIANKKFFPKEPGSISSTWGGGHLIDLAVGRQTIKIIKKKKLLNNAKKMGKYLHKRVQELPRIKNPRGIGLMRAFDLSTVKERNNIIKRALQQGLVLLGCGEKGIRLAPPLIINKNHINEAIKIIENSIKKSGGKR